MIGLRWQFGSVSPFYQSDRKLLLVVKEVSTLATALDGLDAY